MCYGAQRARCWDRIIELGATDDELTGLSLVSTATGVTRSSGFSCTVGVVSVQMTVPL